MGCNIKYRLFPGSYRRAQSKIHRHHFRSKLMKSPTRHLATFAAIVACAMSTTLTAAPVATDQVIEQKADAQVNHTLVADTVQPATVQASQQSLTTVAEVYDNTLVTGGHVALQKAGFQPMVGFELLNANIRDAAFDSRTATPQTVIASVGACSVVGVHAFSTRQPLAVVITT